MIMAPPQSAHLRLIPSPSLTESLLKEQRLDDFSSLANLTLSCDDGSIQVHRCLLANASPVVQKMLINEDPSEPSFIHLDGYSIEAITKLMELIYTGRSSLMEMPEQMDLHSLMATLGFPLTDVLFKIQNVNNNTSATTANHVDDLFRVDRRSLYSESEVSDSEIHGEGEDDKENNEDSESVIGMSPPQSNLMGVGNYIQPRQRRPPPFHLRAAKRAMDFRQRSKTTARQVLRLPSLNLGPPTNLESSRYASRSRSPSSSTSPGDPIWTECTKCASCFKRFPTEKELADHLAMDCAETLKSYFNYEKRCCIVCERDDFPNLWGLLEHCETCDNWKNPQNGKSPSNEPTTDPSPETIAKESASKQTNPRKKRQPRRTSAARDKTDDDKLEPTGPAYNEEGPPRKRLRPEAKKSKVFSDEDKSEEGNSQQPPSSIEQRKPSNSKENPNEEPVIDPDLVRKQLGVQSASDIASLPSDKLRQLFYRCPFCKKQHHRVITLTTCLRNHGYRYCWVCLKLFPSSGFAFDAHSTMEHCIRHTLNDDDDDDDKEDGEEEKQIVTSNKVHCPLCSLPFEYKNALPAHMGSVHSLQLTYGEDVPGRGGINASVAKAQAPGQKPRSSTKGRPRKEATKSVNDDVEVADVIEEQQEDDERKDTPIPDHCFDFTELSELGFWPRVGRNPDSDIESDEYDDGNEVQQAETDLDSIEPQLNYATTLDEDGNHSGTTCANEKHEENVIFDGNSQEDENKKAEVKTEKQQDLKVITEPDNKSPQPNPANFRSSCAGNDANTDESSTITVPTTITSSTTPASSTSPSLPFPAQLNGEWKFVREQRYGEAVYGLYANRKNKVIGVPYRKVFETKDHEGLGEKGSDGLL